MRFEDVYLISAFLVLGLSFLLAAFIQTDLMKTEPHLPCILFKYEEIKPDF